MWEEDRKGLNWWNWLGILFSFSNYQIHWMKQQSPHPSRIRGPDLLDSVRNRKNQGSCSSFFQKSWCLAIGKTAKSGCTSLKRDSIYGFIMSEPFWSVFSSRISIRESVAADCSLRKHCGLTNPKDWPDSCSLNYYEAQVMRGAETQQLQVHSTDFDGEKTRKNTTELTLNLWI